MTLFFANSYISTSISIASILARLDLGFTKAAGNPIVAKGTAGQWDDFGTRELRVVGDEDGLAVSEVDGFWAYYSGYPDGTGLDAGIGLVKSTDNGVSWSKYVSNPVIAKGGTGWYQDSVAQPSVVKQDAGTRIMMAQGHSSGSSLGDGIGCFSSADGLSWSDEGKKIGLTDCDEGGSPFDEIGVPSFIKRTSGDYLMLFEAHKTGVTNGWRIFGATASDPTGTWTMLNSGQPLLTPTGTGWESVGVANPQIIESSPGTYALVYNGITSTATWKVGFAYSTDLTSWTRYSGNPILSPGASGQWDDLHTEAGFLWKEPSAGVLRIHYNGFKSGTGSPQCGAATA